MLLLVGLFLPVVLFVLGLRINYAFSLPKRFTYCAFVSPKVISHSISNNAKGWLISSSILHSSSLHDDVNCKTEISIPDSINIELDRLLTEIRNPSISAIKKVYTLRAIASRRFLSLRGKQFVDKISRDIENLVDQVPAEHLPDFIWSLAQFRLSHSDPQHRSTIDQLICRTAECISKIPLSSLSKCISGIGLLSVNLKDGQLSPRIYEKIMHIVEMSIHHNVSLSNNSIYMLLHGVFLLRIRWENLSSRSQQNIFAILLSISKTQSSKDEHTALDQELRKENEDLFIYHLSGLGLHKRYMSPAVEAAYLTIAKRTLQSISLKAVKLPEAIDDAAVLMSSIIYSLGKSGILYKTLSPSFLTALYDASEKTFLHLSSRDLSAALYGLGLMNTPWNNLPMSTKKVILQRVIQIMDEMNPQSLTNVVYGLCLMQAPLHIFPRSFQHALHARVTEIFTDMNHFAKANKQSLSNILYAIANTGYQWTDLPTKTRSALLRGINTYADYFIPQEFSVTISSLGILRAPYSLISKDIERTVIKVFQRLEPELKTLHSICTLISGLGRMGATWATLPSVIKEITLRIIMEGNSPTAISLPCIFNSFGQLEVSWSELSSSLRTHLGNLSKGMFLTEQSLSNTVFGLGTMDAKWDSLEQPLKECLTRSLSDPKSLALYYPQHISNIVWGLSKMKISRSDLNRFKIVDYIVPSAKSMSMKELAQVVYGLSLMDFSWNDLSVELVEILTDAIVDYTTMVTSQDVANMMYSLSLLCYDTDLSILDASLDIQAANDISYRKAHAALLLFDYFLEKYSSNYLEWVVANQQHDQYQIFLVLMKVLSLESKAFQTVLDRHFPLGIQHCVTGPSATLPSITHSILCQQLSQSLKATVSSEFSIFNEYLGCEGGVFPMDMAIFLGDSLAAFVEVDGAFHYRQCPKTGQWTLRRIDLLKEYLYRKLFPQIPILRVSAMQCAFPVIVHNIQQVLLNEVDPRINRWNKEWKTILLHDFEKNDFVTNNTDSCEMEYVNPQQTDDLQINKHTMNISVRLLHPWGTAFIEEVIPYAEELNRTKWTHPAELPSESQNEAISSSKPKRKRVS